MLEGSLGEAPEQPQPDPEAFGLPPASGSSFSHHRLEMTILARLRVVVQSNDHVYVKELLKAPLKAYKKLLISLPIFYQLVEAQSIPAKQLTP